MPHIPLRKYFHWAVFVKYSSLLTTALLILGLLGLCGLDLFLRIYADQPLLLSAGSSVVLLFLGAVLIISARSLSIRSALQDIPKLYVPINPSDLPKRVHRLIQADLSKVATISRAAVPRPQDALDLGWGKLGSQLEGVNFRKAAIQTFDLIEQAARDISPLLKRDASTSARRHIHLLIHHGFVHPDIGRYYVDGYEQLRFARREASETEYREFMKLVAMILKG
ncbi:hypothetical protein HKX48_002734 [Thoreauomyces humboldtii]|nr:hypothetical protein HKX48_002734 [Thoreauomyces humboldtii]